MYDKWEQLEESIKNCKKCKLDNNNEIIEWYFDIAKEIGKENITDNDLLIIKKRLSNDELDKLYDESKQTIIWIYNIIQRMKEL